MMPHKTDRRHGVNHRAFHASSYMQSAPCLVYPKEQKIRVIFHMSFRSEMCAKAEEDPIEALVNFVLRKKVFIYIFASVSGIITDSQPKL